MYQSLTFLLLSNYLNNPRLDPCFVWLVTDIFVPLNWPSSWHWPVCEKPSGHNSPNSHLHGDVCRPSENIFHFTHSCLSCANLMSW